jgi:hypothetical protein
MEKTKGRRAGPKQRYDFAALRVGRWYTFHWKKDAKPGERTFSCQPQSFVSTLHTRADAMGLDVETTKPDLMSVRFRLLSREAEVAAQ